MEDEKKEKEKEVEEKKKGEECETKREYIGMKRFVPPPDSSCVIALDDLKTGAQRVVDEVNRTFSRDGTAYLPSAWSPPFLDRAQLTRPRFPN